MLAPGRLDSVQLAPAKKPKRSIDDSFNDSIDSAIENLIMENLR